MNIAVYCGSLGGNDAAYIKAAANLGIYIAEHGHNLVYGGSDAGLMGVLARKAHENGAKIYGFGLERFASTVGNFKSIDELVVVKTFSERKSLMMKKADAYIALPGGTGTLDEISDIACLGHFDYPEKEIIFFNVKGFYDGIRQWFEHAAKEGFLYVGALDRIHFCSSIEEIDAVLNHK